MLDNYDGSKQGTKHMKLWYLLLSSSPPTSFHIYSLYPFISFAFAAQRIDLSIKPRRLYRRSPPSSTHICQLKRPVLTNSPPADGSIQGPMRQHQHYIRSTHTVYDAPGSRIPIIMA